MTGDFDFSGKTALVTGAASGIGAATARWLDRHGIEHLVLIDIDRPGLDRLEVSCAATRIGGDAADPALWTAVRREPFAIDAAFLNSGIASGGVTIADLDIAEWRKVMAVNLDGTFLGLRTVMRNMRGRGGSVVITSSASGIRSFAGTAAYATSKAAVIQLMKVAALEGGPDAIRVNCIAPGPVETPIWGKMGMDLGGADADAMRERLKAGTALKRVPDADEIAASVGFLLSDLAANITGTVLVSEGGGLLPVQ